MLRSGWPSYSALADEPCDESPPLTGFRHEQRRLQVARRREIVLGASFLQGIPTLDAKLFHPVNQRCSLHTKSLGSAIPAANHPIACFQSLEDMFSLNLLETRHGHD